MMNQKYTSANTSINTGKNGKLPAIYGKLRKLGVSLDNALDYGCGKHFDNYNLGKGVKGYDCFNYIHPENLTRTYDVVISSNVLNVIMEEEVREEVLWSMAQQCLHGATVYITVHVGNSSGIGCPTSADSWQENRKLKSYLPEVKKVFPDAYIKHVMIIAPHYDSH